jgi:hypothetical protein
MKVLRHPDIVRLNVPSQVLHARMAAHAAMYHRPCSRTGQVERRRRAHWVRSIGHVLLVGRDVLFALWALLVLAFWLLIIASFAL